MSTCTMQCVLYYASILVNMYVNHIMETYKFPSQGKTTPCECFTMYHNYAGTFLPLCNLLVPPINKQVEYIWKREYYGRGRGRMYPCECDSGLEPLLIVFVQLSSLSYFVFIRRNVVTPPYMLPPTRDRPCRWRCWWCTGPTPRPSTSWATTPEECARIAGHHQLADRLIECQYELTDKLSFFLCGRKPVHSIGEHFLVPQGST